MKLFLSGVLGFIICFGIFVGLDVRTGAPELIIQTNNVIQYKTTTEYIKIPYTTTKTNIYTNYLYILDELNEYLTAPGWISQSNKQIYAGIKSRVWSIPYSIAYPKYKHEISLLIGDGVLLDYGYQILERFKIHGALYSRQSENTLLVGASYRFQ